MTSRAIPQGVRNELEAASSSTALLCFVKIEHDDLDDDVRVVCDPLPYVWGGEQYEGVIFDFKILTDDDEFPFTELTLPNVDRRIGEAVRATKVRPRVGLYMLSAADFDLSQNPRTQIGTPVPVYSFEGFEISEVAVDVAEIRARVVMRDYSTEPFPGISATQSRFPGLFK